MFVHAARHVKGILVSDWPSRRSFLAVGSISAASLVLSGCSLPLSDRKAGNPFAELEAQFGGRLGVTCLDTATGAKLEHRANERFALCSTFKLALAAFVLQEADAGRLSLDERLTFGEADMLSYAPVTSRHLASGEMTIRALAEAAQSTSDNVAANLLLTRLGGPQGFNNKLRSLGDTVTRLDRMEPELNIVWPGDPRDTTTPAAMAALLVKLTAGDWLTESSQGILIDWMRSTQTGANRLRAGLPETWLPGTKTGTAYYPGMANKYNDIAVAWPPTRDRLIITAYYEATEHQLAVVPEHEAVLAEVGRLATAWTAAL